MQEAIRILMGPEDMLEAFSEFAVNVPDLMRLVLQASVAALVNVPSVEVVDTELKRRAVVGNRRGPMVAAAALSLRSREVKALFVRPLVTHIRKLRLPDEGQCEVLTLSGAIHSLISSGIRV